MDKLYQLGSQHNLLLQYLQLYLCKFQQGKELGLNCLKDSNVLQDNQLSQRQKLLCYQEYCLMACIFQHRI